MHHDKLSKISFVDLALCKASSEVESRVDHPGESAEDEVPHFIPVEELYTSSTYYGDSEESNVNDSSDPMPSDVKSVSKFIQEFHVSILDNHICSLLIKSSFKRITYHQ